MEETTLPGGSAKVSASDFVSNIHKIIDDRLREILPFTGRVQTKEAEGYTVLRGGDDTNSLAMPMIVPASYETNDRVLVVPSPDGYGIIVGEISTVPNLKYHYHLGPFTRDNISGTASFTMRVYIPSGQTTFGTLATTLPAAANGRCVGGVIVSSEARTGGEAYLGIEVNGVDTQISTIRLGSSPNQSDSNILPYYSGVPVNKGDAIRAKVIATNWAPTTADFTAWLFMVGDVPG